MELRKFNVTVKRFDPTRTINDDPQATEFVLPVDSPDEEHAISAAMSNAVAFTPKLRLGSLVPVAFACVGVHERP